jgi:Ca-activated chloride channel family protein
MLEFAHPGLFCLLPLPWLVRYFGSPVHQPRVAVQVPFLDRLARVTGRAPRPASARYRRSRGQWLVLGLAWLALVAALARPQWLEQPLVREEPRRDLLLALDLSGSMEVADFEDAAGGALDRLSAAKTVLDDFLTRREGDRVGLILFGSAAFLQAPFTDDLELVRELLDEASVRMLGPRTVLGDALGLGISLFERSEVSERVLIVLTDGNDTGSLVPPERAAEIASDLGVTVHAVALGDPSAAGEQALDEATLRAVASGTGGDYFRANDRAELERVYARLDQLNPRQVETISYRPRTDLYDWPVGLGLVLVMLFHALAAWKSWRRRRAGLTTNEAPA